LTTLSVFQKKIKSPVIHYKLPLIHIIKDRVLWKRKKLRAIIAFTHKNTLVKPVASASYTIKCAFVDNSNLIPFEALWKAVLDQIELSISRANFVTWFKNTSILSLENGKVIIGVPNGFAKEWLENKYNHYLLRAFHSVQSEVSEIHCQITPDKPITPALPREPIRSLDMIQRPSLDGFLRKKLTGSPSVRPQLEFSQEKPHNNNLNTRYLFENFIVAENNELAKAACYAVSQNLGTTYNPLFIYGGVGLGKTHLLQSIGNEISQHFPEKKIKYITSERFTTELIDSIKTQKTDQFKEYYQQMDLLIIDDVQFLSGKEKTQIEFFHIFNALYQLNKQIVISSDRPPKAIATLEDRLRSRFEGGMITDISRPNLETRIAILEAKAHERNISIDEHSIRFIAEHITQNIRELEGALNRIHAFSEFHKIPTTLAVTTRVLEQLIENNRKSIKSEDIFRVIIDYYGVSEESLIKKGRKKEIVHSRQMTMYLLRNELQMSLASIGTALGGRDHTTVLHACEKIEKGLHENIRLKEELNTLKERLYYATCG
jgi:chromosomal replication initiator protein